MAMVVARMSLPPAMRMKRSRTASCSSKKKHQNHEHDARGLQRHPHRGEHPLHHLHGIGRRIVYFHGDGSRLLSSRGLFERAQCQGRSARAGGDETAGLTAQGVERPTVMSLSVESL